MALKFYQYSNARSHRPLKMLRINFWDFYWAAGERVEENRKKKTPPHIFLGSTRTRSIISNRKHLWVPQELCSWKETKHHHIGGTLGCSVRDLSSWFFFFFSLIHQILNCHFLETYAVSLYAFPNSPTGDFFNLQNHEQSLAFIKKSFFPITCSPVVYSRLLWSVF